jgi:hypothetical protein
MLTEFGVAALLKNGPPVKFRHSAPARPCSQRTVLIFSDAYRLDETSNGSVSLPALCQSGNGGKKP